MINVVLAAVGAVAFVIAALSGKLRSLPVSAPLLGLVTGVVLGPAVTGVLDWPTLTADSATMHEVTRALLAVSVMAVALRYPVSEARTRVRPVVLLLLVVMPLMAVVTAGVSALVLGVGLGAAVLLGAAMAPTDPVLASSAVTGKPAETNLPARDRQVLSLESGANDGLALPLVLVALALSGVAGAPSMTDALTEAAYQVLGGAVVGVALGWLGGRAMRAGENDGETERGPKLLFTLVLAAGVLGVSGLLKVDGVLAVFVAGLAFNRVSSGEDREGAVPVDEAVNQFLVLPLFLFLGATLPWGQWQELGWRGPALAVAVILLRRIPVLLLLHRPLGLHPAGAAYLGWFGPVGVSALFYLTLEAKRLGTDEAVLAAGALVVAVSTVAHGLSSPVGIALYKRATGRHATPVDEPT